MVAESPTPPAIRSEVRRISLALGSPRPALQRPRRLRQYYPSELDELVQGYGDLTEFWLDGAGSGGHVYNFPRIIEGLRTYQPNALVFADIALFDYGDIRWVGNETGRPLRKLECDRPSRLPPLASRRGRHPAPQGTLVLAPRR